VLKRLDYRVHRGRDSALRRDSGGRRPGQQVRGEITRLAQTSAIHQSHPTDVRAGCRAVEKAR
jgi:hypothetical protein